MILWFWLICVWIFRDFDCFLPTRIRDAKMKQIRIHNTAYNYLTRPTVMIYPDQTYHPDEHIIKFKSSRQLCFI